MEIPQTYIHSCVSSSLIFTNVVGDNEDTTPHDQSSEKQFIPSSPNLLSDQANRITWSSLGEFADIIIFRMPIILLCQVFV